MSTLDRLCLLCLGVSVIFLTLTCLNLSRSLENINGSIIIMQETNQMLHNRILRLEALK